MGRRFVAEMVELAVSPPVDDRELVYESRFEAAQTLVEIGAAKDLVEAYTQIYEMEQVMNQREVEHEQA